MPNQSNHSKLLSKAPPNFGEASFTDKMSNARNKHAANPLSDAPKFMGANHRLSCPCL